MTSYGGITRIRLKGRSSSTSSQPAIQAPLYLFVEVIIYQIPGKCKYYTAMLLRELRSSPQDVSQSAFHWGGMTFLNAMTLPTAKVSANKKPSDLFRKSDGKKVFTH